MSEQTTPLEWRRANDNDVFHDGDSLFVAIMTQHRATCEVSLRYDVIHAVGDSETPLHFVDQFGDNVEWDEVSYWIPIGELPAPPNPFKETPHA